MLSIQLSSTSHRQIRATIEFGGKTMTGSSVTLSGALRNLAVEIQDAHMDADIETAVLYPAAETVA